MSENSCFDQKSATIQLFLIAITCFNIVKRILILLTVSYFVQCKSTSDVSQQTENESQPIPIMLLLDENLSLADLAVVKEYQIENMKRTSRSQNQWMINVVGDEGTVRELLEKLKMTEGVQECSLPDDNQESKEIENIKSGSGTIKNK